MTYLLEKPIKKQRESLSVQIETVQEDLLRVFKFIAHLSVLSDEELLTFDISDQLDFIHRCLNRFEARCLSIQVAAYENEFEEPFIDETCESFVFPNHEWNDARKHAKRANKLANQLTLTLTKIRSGFGGLQAQASVPKDIEQLNQAVGYAVNGLASEWNSNLG